MSGSHSTPSLVQSTRTKLYRTALDSPSARARLQREQRYMMKELEKLEKQKTVAVSNVDNDRHAIKLLQQQIQRRQSDSDASAIQRSPTRQTYSRHERRTILQNQTVVAVPSSSEFGPLTSSHAGHQTEQTTDAAEATQPQDEETCTPKTLPEHLNPDSSPYISSPLLYARRNVLPKPFKSRPFSLAPVSSPPGRSDEGEVRLPPVTLHARPGTATKNKLKRVDLTGLGLDASSSGPESFKHFYSSGAPYASAVFDMENHEDDEEEHVKKVDSEEQEPQTLEELFEEIRRCRYIRIYQPRGGRHQPSVSHTHQPSVSQAWQFERTRSNSTIK